MISRNASALLFLGLLAVGDDCGLSQALPQAPNAPVTVPAIGSPLPPAQPASKGNLGVPIVLSRDESIKLHEDLLAKYRAAHDEQNEADQMITLGDLRAQAGDRKSGLDLENQALEICVRRTFPSLAGKAVHNIGWIYYLMGESLEALKYYNQALPMRHAVGDLQGEWRTTDNIGQVYATTGRPLKALNYYQQALAIRRQMHDRRSEAEALNAIGRVYWTLGKPPEAMDSYTEALKIYRELHDQRGEAQSLENISATHFRMEEYQKSLDGRLSELEIWRTVNDPAAEATAARAAGLVYLTMGNDSKALEYFQESIRIRHEIGNRKEEASNFYTIGRHYFSVGKDQLALQNWNDGLQIRRELDDRSGEASNSYNIGLLFAHNGQYERALTYLEQSRSIRHDSSDQTGEANALEAIGWIYGLMGQNRKSLQYSNDALNIKRVFGSRGNYAGLISDMSTAYAEIGQTDQALKLANEALSIWIATANPGGEAHTLHTLGWICQNMGQSEKALGYFEKALPIHRESNHVEDEIYTLGGIGEAADALGDHNKALTSEVAALSLAKKARNPYLEGQIDTSLMGHWRRQNQPDTAIFFGVEAVNSFQRIRAGIAELDDDAQTSFVETYSGTYRQLAELLVQADRLAEAEQVMDLLKEQELQELVRGGPMRKTAKLDPIGLSDAQQRAQGQMPIPEKAALALTDLGIEYSSLMAKPERTTQEATRMKALAAQIEERNGEVFTFFGKTLFPELARRTNAEDANALLNKEKSEVSRLQNTLAELGPNVAGIRILMGDEHVYAIVVTAQTREKFQLNVTSAQLRSKVLEVRDELRSPLSHPQPHLAELYAMVVSPMERDLQALEQMPQKPARNASGAAPGIAAPTLLWSLDGVLRYLPMSALYDGRRYMAERFNNVLFTPESYGHMAPSSITNMSSFHALAMGLSKSYRGLPALPGVIPELNAIVHDSAMPASHGPLDGTMLPDEMFTYQALKEHLGPGTAFPVVHIASHFVMESRDGSEPYLMLGGEDAGAPDGYTLTLSRFANSPISFHGTRLLTLSACSTAASQVAESGMEMDSLGMVAQQKDAEAVLATLWDVNDASTAKLMSDFYGRWVKNPARGKANALRQAQLAFIHEGSANSDGAVSGRDASVINSEAVVSEPRYSHPYYWAPFVLTGNFQ